MALGINIPFIADVSRWLKGTRDVEGSLDDVSDSITDLTRESARASDTAGDALSDGIRDGARTAGRSVDELQDDVRTAMRQIAQRSREAGDDIGDNVRKGTKRAESGVDELRDEANSTAREAAASFDGSAESIADAFQEVAANAFAGFGPAGALAGLAVAAGLGTFVTSWNEQTEAAKARISGMADAMIEANSRVLAEDFINEQLRAIYTGADDAAVKIDTLRKMAKDTGIDESQLARAFAGDQDARVDALNRVRGAAEQAFQDTFSMDQAQVDSATKRQAEVSRWIDDLEKLGGEYDTAASDLAGYTAAVAAGHDAANRNVQSTIDTVALLHKSLDGLPTSKTTTVTVVPDLTQADRDIDAWARRPRRVGVSIAANIMQPV